MKYNLILLSILFSCISLSSYAIGKTHVIIDGGMVHMRGSISEPACSISPESQNQIIDLGVISSNKFHGVGSRSVKIPFTLKLMDCNKNISDKVSFLMLGDVNKTDGRIFNIVDQISSASGVGIALYNQEDDIIIPNLDNKYIFIKENKTELNFSARYIATHEHVIGGKADATVLFIIKYN